MRILDQVFGPGNWQRTHEVINGNLFCNIDIWDAEKRAWVRKQDVGVESNTEKEKGQASDAFKRAGFNVGIGRELYTGPFIYVELADNEFYSEGQNGRKEVLKCYSNTRFTVTHVAYNDRREICELVIADRNGNVRFDHEQEGPGTATDSPGRPGNNHPGKHPGTGQTGPQGPPGRASGYTSAPGRERGSLPDLWETNHKGRTGLFRPEIWSRSLSDLSKSIVKGGGKRAEPHNQRINHYQRIAVGGERGRRAPFLATGGSRRTTSACTTEIRESWRPCASPWTRRRNRKSGPGCLNWSPPEWSEPTRPARTGSNT